MRMLTRLVVSAATAAAAIAMAAAPALADPPSGTVPKASNIVGVGSDTIQNVMDQFSHDYNASHTANKLYSWDATNPTTGAVHDSIVDKSGCSAIPRPNGSSEGITALTTENGTTSGHPCIDFARSSRDRTSTDPAYASGGIAFVDLAGDGVTWAANSTTNAPATLTPKQLAGIYECTITNWSQVGGKSGAINAFLPQTGSGTRAFFLTALGGGTAITPGSCVSSPSTLEENEGVDSVLAGPNTIFPYSIGKWIAEKDHSAKCFNTGCTPNSNGKVCNTGVNGTNLYGCNTHGTMTLKKINNSNPLVGTAPSQTINPNFTKAFLRTVFEVVKYSTSTTDHIPGYLEPFFGHTGYVCANATAQKDLKNYGFLLHTTTCGLTH